MITIDFETEAIEARPKYPPKPVGVAIKLNSEKSTYFAWGHPSGNNCTRAKAKEILEKLWDSGENLIFQNAKFDIDVAETHFGLARLPWERVHDTMYLLFLKDPHASTLSLKPSAERYLGLPPDERDAVRDWLVAHGVIGANQNPGPFIAKCDGRVVGDYARGDVDRTYALFQLLHPQIRELGMERAYNRERELMPILLDNERTGIRTATTRLEMDLEEYEKALVLVERWLRRALKTPSLNLDADAEVADALHKVGAVTQWKLTPTGRKSVSKANLIINHIPIATALNYRNRLQNLLAQSLRPWLAQALINKGFIFTEWNQVRTSRGSDISGTRTGRPSCSRFMNIAKSMEGIPTPTFIKGCPPLPLVRGYLVPDEGGIWVHRDYNQQEFRITAHYENDTLLEAYQREPRIDYHENMGRLIKEVTGQTLARKDVKILNFGINYGMGLGKLAASLKVDVETARKLRDAQRRAAPGVQALDAELKRRGRSGEPVRTWGGRLYYCEPPAPDGRTFEYKLLNYLIQGSAADCTKEAIIRWYRAKVKARLLNTVYDEINISAPVASADLESEILREAMEGIEFDVPMLTDEKRGPNWGSLKGIK